MTRAAGRAVRAIATHPGAAWTWRALLVLLLVAVSYLALAPKPPAGVDTGWDKLNHVLAFTALALCASLGYPASRRTRQALLGGLLAYGGAIELLQLSVPSRSAEWSDLLADSIGIGAGAIVATLVLRLATLQTARSP